MTVRTKTTANPRSYVVKLHLKREFCSFADCQLEKQESRRRHLKKDLKTARRAVPGNDIADHFMTLI